MRRRGAGPGEHTHAWASTPGLHSPRRAALVPDPPGPTRRRRQRGRGGAGRDAAEAPAEPLRRCGQMRRRGAGPDERSRVWPLHQGPPHPGGRPTRSVRAAGGTSVRTSGQRTGNVPALAQRPRGCGRTRAWTWWTGPAPAQPLSRTRAGHPGPGPDSPGRDGARRGVPRRRDRADPHAARPALLEPPTQGRGHSRTSTPVLLPGAHSRVALTQEGPNRSVRAAEGTSVPTRSPRTGNAPALAHRPTRARAGAAAGVDVVVWTRARAAAPGPRPLTLDHGLIRWVAMVIGLMGPARLERRPP